MRESNESMFRAIPWIRFGLGSLDCFTWSCRGAAVGHRSRAQTCSSPELSSFARILLLVCCVTCQLFDKPRWSQFVIMTSLMKCCVRVGWYYPHLEVSLSQIVALMIHYSIFDVSSLCNLSFKSVLSMKWRANTSPGQNRLLHQFPYIKQEWFWPKLGGWVSHRKSCYT
jgi:hypothetical protein